MWGNQRGRFNRISVLNMWTCKYVSNNCVIHNTCNISQYLKVGYGILFFGHFCKITWNPYHNTLTATELEVLTWILASQSSVERAGLEKPQPMISRPTEWHWTVSTSIKQSNCTRPALPSPAPRATPSCTHSKLVTQSKPLFIVILRYWS